jgi:hypothetical protein
LSLDGSSCRRRRIGETKTKDDLGNQKSNHLGKRTSLLTGCMSFFSCILLTTLFAYEH